MEEQIQEPVLGLALASERPQEQDSEGGSGLVAHWAELGLGHLVARTLALDSAEASELQLGQAPEPQTLNKRPLRNWQTWPRLFLFL